MTLRQEKMPGGWAIDLFRDGRSISRLWIADRQMRVGSQPVKIGGIAGVGTDPAFRNEGLASRIMEAALELMKHEGYDASFLYGIPDFYHRFGFTTCMPQHSLEIETRRAECAQKMLKMRTAQKADYTTIARIYNRDSTKRTASCWRDPKRWYGFPMGSGFGVPCKAHVAIDHRDRVVGYVLYDDVDTHCRIAEVGGQSRAIFHTLLHDMARRAVRLRRPSLSLSLPPDHPFALFCRDYGCIDHTAYERNAGPMGRLVNLHTCIEKILPELANRWRLLDRKQVLAVRTDLGHFTLSWQDERLHMERDALRTAARLDQRALTELLLGYKTASSLKANDQLACNRTQLTLLEHLFPPQQAHMSWPDRF